MKATITYEKTNKTQEVSDIVEINYNSDSISYLRGDGSFGFFYHTDDQGGKVKVIFSEDREAIINSFFGEGLASLEAH